MLQASWYLIKVLLCSGILLGYYWVMLRNKLYHHYNRFFLLLSVVLSLTLPLLKINILHPADAEPSQAIQLLQVVNSGDDFVSTYVPGQHTFYFTTSQLLSTLYIIVSIILMIAFIRVLWIIRTLIYTYKGQVVERFFFINTRAKGTPFSFLNYIFWNEEIDLESETGKQIFRHEVAHVREHHSLDKLFLNFLLIFFWCNPFFWLIRKEINMIHEFIADKKAVEDSNTAAFAAMILQAAYPGHRFELVNNFFYSPIKRRLLMLTKNQNPRVSYISRILVLPLAAFVIAAFTLKAKVIPAATTIAASQQLTVVIDPGHGGSDAGGININGLAEKDLNLAIARRIKALNTDENIRIILTREDDKAISVQDRTAIALKEKADLFVSIHMDSETKGSSSGKSGLSVFVARDQYTNAASSKLFASALINVFKSNYSLPVESNPKQRQAGIWVLQSAPCPSVLIEAGYITSSKDAEYLRSTAGQETIARNILNSITSYAQNRQTQKMNEPVAPALAEVEITAPVAETDSTFVIAAREVPAQVTRLQLSPVKTTVESAAPLVKEVNVNNVLVTPARTGADPLYIIDGVKVTGEVLKTLNPETIATVNVLKSPEVIKTYGPEGAHGVIVIATKPAVAINIKTVPAQATTLAPAATGTATIQNIKGQAYTVQPARPQGVAQVVEEPQPLFTKVETEAAFPGGNEAWKKYLTTHLDASLPIKEGWAKGNYVITLQFIVDKDGSLSNITALNYPDSKTAAHCIKMLQNGPKWIPASQNGHIVKSYRRQPVTFVITEK